MRKILLLPVLAALISTAWARPFTVVVYNVENLHDADGVAVYDDYQPAAYTQAHALTKVKNIASVIARSSVSFGMLRMKDRSTLSVSMGKCLIRAREE